jgi:hypothetical protein
MVLEDSSQIPSQRNQIPCIRPDDENFSSGPSFVSRTFELSSLHPSGRLSNTVECPSVFDKEKNFVPKHRYGKIAATVWTMCVPVQTLSLIRQVVHTKLNRPDVGLHGPAAHSLDMEIAFS